MAAGSQNGNYILGYQRVYFNLKDPGKDDLPRAVDPHAGQRFIGGVSVGVDHRPSIALEFYSQAQLCAKLRPRVDLILHTSRVEGG